MKSSLTEALFFDSEFEFRALVLEEGLTTLIIEPFEVEFVFKLVEVTVDKVLEGLVMIVVGLVFVEELIRELGLI